MSITVNADGSIAIVGARYFTDIDADRAEALALEVLGKRHGPIRLDHDHGWDKRIATVVYLENLGRAWPPSQPPFDPHTATDAEWLALRNVGPKMLARIRERYPRKENAE